MELRLSVVAIEGDRLDAVPLILDALGLDGYVPPRPVASWAAFSAEVHGAWFPGRGPVGACAAGGWTLVWNEDLAAVLLEEGGALASLAARLGTRVCALVADSRAGHYGVRVEGGGASRFLLAEAGEVYATGEPLSGEVERKNRRFKKKDFRAVLDGLGIDLLDAPRRSKAYQISWPSAPRRAGVVPGGLPAARKRPWWRFWG
jgi:hypothetical protein